MTKRRALCGLLCAGFLGLVPTAGARADAPSVQSVVALNATIASGYLVAPWRLGHDFNALFVVPTAAVGTPLEGGLDLTRAWAGLEEESGGAVGSTAYCNSLSNPASAAGDGLTGTMYFDAACNDGSGFLFYRVSWRQVGGFLPASTLGRVASTEWDTSSVTAAVSASTASWYSSQVSICGAYLGAKGLLQFNCVQGVDPNAGWQPGEAWSTAGVTLANLALETSTAA